MKSFNGIRNKVEVKQKQKKDFMSTKNNQNTQKS